MLIRFALGAGKRKSSLVCCTLALFALAVTVYPGNGRSGPGFLPVPVLVVARATAAASPPSSADKTHPDEMSLHERATKWIARSDEIDGVELMGKSAWKGLESPYKVEELKRVNNNVDLMLKLNAHDQTNEVSAREDESVV